MLIENIKSITQSSPNRVNSSLEEYLNLIYRFQCCYDEINNDIHLLNDCFTCLENIETICLNIKQYGATPALEALVGNQIELSESSLENFITEGIKKVVEFIRDIWRKIMLFIKEHLLGQNKLKERLKYLIHDLEKASSIEPVKVNFDPSMIVTIIGVHKDEVKNCFQECLDKIKEMSGEKSSNGSLQEQIDSMKELETTILDRIHHLSELNITKKENSDKEFELTDAKKAAHCCNYAITLIDLCTELKPKVEATEKELTKLIDEDYASIAKKENGETSDIEEQNIREHIILMRRFTAYVHALVSGTFGNAVKVGTVCLSKFKPVNK